MRELRSFTLIDWILFVLVLAAAAGARWGYMNEFVLPNEKGADAVWHVQEKPPAEGTSTDQLVAHMAESGLLPGFVAKAPFSAKEGPTAFYAPGYPFFRAFLEQKLQGYVADKPNPKSAAHGLIRWIQVGLGSLTAALYFAIGRRAFHSRLVGLLAGLFCAANPFWIINSAELQDGTLAAFLLALALALGVRIGQQGGPLASLLYGIVLAALALTRAALLPFAIVAVLWFLARSRTLKGGWLSALVALLGFAGGLTPWILRNYQDFHEVIPIVDSGPWHLWVGNNPQATGGPFTADMEQQLSDERRKALSDLPEERRYLSHLPDVREEVLDSPTATFKRRLMAIVNYFLSTSVASGGPILDAESGPTPPPWLGEALYGALLAMIFLALLGWRWSYGWKHEAMPLSLAVFWIPLPYILGHAARLHESRLPLDGPLLCLAAMGLICLLPGFGHNLLRGEEHLQKEGDANP